MPTLTHDRPGLLKMLADLAKKHCRTVDQEATVGLRLYVAEGAEVENLPEELVRQAHEPRDPQKPPQDSLPQDVCLPLWKLAENHERTPAQEAAWGLLWYIDQQQRRTEQTA
jgi:hypothetical protein